MLNPFKWLRDLVHSLTDPRFAEFDKRMQEIEAEAKGWLRCEECTLRQATARMRTRAILCDVCVTRYFEGL